MDFPEHPPASEHRCPVCGLELPPHASAEDCPKCLLKAALAIGLGETTAALPRGAGSARPAQRPQSGETFAHYQIGRLLGSGGMGAVYEAEDLETHRRVALKILHQRFDKPDARQRFLREGRIAASINHPHSVYVFGTEEWEGIPMIAMELMSGGTLAERVRSAGPYDIREAADIALQIINGLEAAHAVGILHRDIKPSNCFLDSAGGVKIGDFGLSISTEAHDDMQVVIEEGFMGTPAFASPEQVRGDELTRQSDIYSVGVTLFYLLTARLPMKGATRCSSWPRSWRKPPQAPPSSGPIFRRHSAALFFNASKNAPPIAIIVMRSYGGR